MPVRRSKSARLNWHQRAPVNVRRRIQRGAGRMSKLRGFVSKANSLAKKHKVLSRATAELAKRTSGKNKQHLLKLGQISSQMGYGLRLAGNGMGRKTRKSRR